jgi:hypothetical protein
MRDMVSLIKIIEDFYPKREGFNEELMPNNKYLESLSEVCNKAKIESPSFNEKLRRLMEWMPDCEIIDDTLFEANEPSFQAYVVNHENKLRLHFQISIIAPYFFIFFQSEKTEYAIEKSAMLLQWLTITFPEHSFLSEKESRQEINWIRVPAYYDEDIITTIAACIFGPRSLKGY